MTRSYDLDELLAFAQRGDSARSLVETLGLTISERHVQRLVRQHLGRRPTREAVRLRDPLRDRVVVLMETNGLDPYRCSACGWKRLEPGFIREQSRDLNISALVFVCRHCSGPADR